MMILFPYIFLLLCFVSIAYLNISTRALSAKSYKVLAITGTIALICFAGCRWNAFDYIGNNIFDYATYKYIFDHPVRLGHFFSDISKEGDILLKVDKGYILLSSLFSRYIIDNYHVWLLFFSFVSVLLFYKGLIRNHIHKYILFVLFMYLARLYFQYNFIIIRQALSMAIVWWAIPYVYHKRWRFVFCCILAATIHFSAVAFIITLILPKLYISNRIIIVTIFLLIISSLFNITSEIIIRIVGSLSSIFGLERLVVAYIENQTSGINPLNFVEMLPFFYLALRYKNQLYASNEGRLFFNMLILYIVYMLVTMNFMGLTRISSYFIYSYFYIVEFAFSRIRMHSERMLIGGVLSIYFILYGVRFIFANFISYPYDFVSFHL